MKRPAAALVLAFSLTTCTREPLTTPGQRGGVAASADKKDNTLPTPTACPACAFGPQVYVRPKGKPTTETAKFPADPAADYIIDVMSGGDDDAKATISLNGKVLSGSGDKEGKKDSDKGDERAHDGKDERNDRGRIHQAVKLLLQNVLEVRLTGDPDSYVVISVVGGAKLVGAAGGTVLAPGGGAQLTIPAGALTAAVEISAQQVSVVATGAGTIPDAVYYMGPAGTTFSTPAQLSLAYDPAKVPIDVSEDDLQLFRAVGGAWVAVPGSVANVATHRVTAPVLGFSAYAVGFPLPASITILAGNNQAQLLSGQYVGQLVVWVRNAASAPMANVTATFAITAGGGSFAGSARVKTDVNGLARVSLVSPATSATQTVTATVVALAPVTFAAKAVSSPGASARCELTTTGAAYCWGRNDHGQIGNGNTTPQLTPTAVAGGLTFASLAEGGAGHACGLTAARVAYCWGANGFGQLGDNTVLDRAAPIAVQGGLAFTKIAVGMTATCALTSAGAMYCWGWAGSGLYGDGAVGIIRATPTLVTTGGLVFAKLAVGSVHVCGLTAAGAAYCWGANGFGQLGDGTFITRQAPTAVAGGATYSALATMDFSTCGVTTAGVAQCWGNNSIGQLGDGTQVTHSSPAPVLGGQTFASITVSNLNSCAVSTAGAAFCWGWNGDGQIGDGTFAQRAVPTPVLGGITFSAVRARPSTVCSRATSGLPYCWGLGSSGELGTGLTTSSATPVLVTWVEGAAGVGVSMVVNGGDGQSAAINTAVSTPPSVLVRDYFNNPVSGVIVTFAVTAGGGSVTGGAATTNASGIATMGSWTLGGAASENKLMVTGAGLPARTFTAIGVEPANVTIFSGDNQVVPVGGIGGSLLGQLVVSVKDASNTPLRNVTVTFAITNGGGSISPSATRLTDASGLARVSLVLPFAVGTHLVTATVAGLTPVTFTANSVANLFNQHQCELTTSGAVYCWGSNGRGQIGDGSKSNRTVPTAVLGGLTFASLATGGASHSCGLTVAGAAYCWGANSYGQVGDNTVVDRTAPTAVQGSLTFATIATGTAATCALTSAGAMYCWGWAGSGLYGDGAVGIIRSTPALVTTGGIMFASVVLGNVHACGLTSAGAAYCWGLGGGRVGDGTFSTRTAPTLVAGGLSFASLTASEVHTCGITTTGGAYCWGNNNFGQLGDGTLTARAVPTAVLGGYTFASITARNNFQAITCAPTLVGAAYCWGSNNNGQLGDGTTTDRLSPTPVLGGIAFSSMHPHFSAVCGRATSGLPYCWGSGINGELGTGLTTSSPTPVLVRWVEGAAGVGVSMVVNGGEGQSAAINTAVPTPPSVLVRDFFNNPVIGARVTFTVTTGGGAVTGDAATTNASGIATVGSWALGSAAGGNTLTATSAGLPTRTFTATGVVLPGLTFVSVEAGESHTCALSTGGAAYCWGRNEHSELGDSSTADFSTPTPVAGGLVFASLAPGIYHTCAIIYPVFSRLSG